MADDDTAEKITTADLAAFLGTTASQMGDEADRVIDAADALVTAAVAGATPPAAIIRQAELMTAGEMWRRRDAPGGVLNSWGDAQVPVRLALDPLKPARPLLAPWIVPGIA